MSEVSESLSSVQVDRIHLQRLVTMQDRLGHLYGGLRDLSGGMPDKFTARIRRRISLFGRAVIAQERVILKLRREQLNYAERSIEPEIVMPPITFSLSSKHKR